jgi:glyoxylase-like metal-dependent hydrolase (beta-lactamase superfamily II)
VTTGWEPGPDGEPPTTNTWVIGDDRECLIVDAAHDGRTIVKSVALERRVTAVLVTHGHLNHIDAVGEVCDGTRAPAYLHPSDRPLWDEYYPVTPDRSLADGDVLTVGGAVVEVLHTPGHTPGSCSFFVPALGVVVTGDADLSGALLALPEGTVVLPGHGDPRPLFAVSFPEPARG